jgi:hypothetical protein
MLEQFDPNKAFIRLAKLEELFSFSVLQVNVINNLSCFWERRQVVVKLLNGVTFAFSMREAKAVACFLHSFELSRDKSFILLQFDRIYLSNGKEDGFFLNGEVFLSRHIVKGYCNIPIFSPFENFSFIVCRVLPPKQTVEKLRLSGEFSTEEELMEKVREIVMAKYQPQP